MTSKPSTCVAIEPDLIAAATGEAVPSAAGRVDAHIAQCASCRNDYAHYQAVETVVGDLRTIMAPADAEDARRRLIERLSDLRSRLVHYQVASSPLGPILIAVTEQGVTLVEYLGRAGAAGSRLFREAGVEAVEGGAEVDRLHRELHEFVEGRRTHLDWSLDLRSARSDFRRTLPASSRNGSATNSTVRGNLYLTNLSARCSSNASLETVPSGASTMACT